MDRTIEIDPARSADDHAAVRDICDAFYDWLKERYASKAWIVETYYPADAWAALMRDLPVIHAEPEGGIWIARVDGEPVGTVMLKAWTEPGSCEMKRLTVKPAARGLGLGRALTARLVNEAKARGYQRLLFDTGIGHREAINLYLSMGFATRSRYYELPDDLAAELVFFEAALDRLPPITP